jgi:hypothetical protein
MVGQLNDIANEKKKEVKGATVVDVQAASLMWLFSDRAQFPTQRFCAPAPVGTRNWPPTLGFSAPLARSQQRGRHPRSGPRPRELRPRQPHRRHLIPREKWRRRTATSTAAATSTIAGAKDREFAPGSPRETFVVFGKS